MASGPVAILGAGTQGRRLAYMVSIPMHSASSYFFDVDANCIQQWSSCGRPVHLIDQTPSQLDDALHAVEQFRKISSHNSPKQHLAGEILTFSIELLQDAIREAWLVVEVVMNQSLIDSSVIPD